MKESEHIKAFGEHKAAISWAVDRGIESSQRIIGTHASRGIIELLSAYLHKLKCIDEGFQLNHRWFKSSNVGSRLPEFPDKAVIVRKLAELENDSEKLTYGSQKSEGEVKKVVELFNEVEKILDGLMKNGQ